MEKLVYLYEISKEDIRAGASSFKKWKSTHGDALRELFHSQEDAADSTKDLEITSIYLLFLLYKQNENLQTKELLDVTELEESAQELVEHVIEDHGDEINYEDIDDALAREDIENLLTDGLRTLKRLEELAPHNKRGKTEK